MSDDIRGIPVDVPPSEAAAFLRGLNDLVRKYGCVVEADTPLRIAKHSTGRWLYDIELLGLYRRTPKQANAAIEAPESGEA